MGKRVGIVAVLVLFLLVAGTTAAIAHRVYNGWATRWDGPDGKCLDHKTSVDHGTSGNGWFQAEIRTEMKFVPPPPLPAVDCYQAWTRQRDELRVRVVVLRGANLNVCLSPGWYYNNGPTAYLAMLSTGFGSPPCGAGQYSSRSRGQVYFNGAWRGDDGGLWSNGFHQLPA